MTWEMTLSSCPGRPERQSGRQVTLAGLSHSRRTGLKSVAGAQARRKPRPFQQLRYLRQSGGNGNQPVALAGHSSSRTAEKSKPGPGCHSVTISEVKSETRGVGEALNPGFRSITDLVRVPTLSRISM